MPCTCKALPPFRTYKYSHADLAVPCGQRSRDVCAWRSSSSWSRRSSSSSDSSSAAGHSWQACSQQMAPRLTVDSGGGIWLPGPVILAISRQPARAWAGVPVSHARPCAPFEAEDPVGEAHVSSLLPPSSVSRSLARSACCAAATRHSPWGRGHLTSRWRASSGVTRLCHPGGRFAAKGRWWLAQLLVLGGAATACSHGHRDREPTNSVLKLSSPPARSLPAPHCAEPPTSTRRQTTSIARLCRRRRRRRC